MTEPDFAWPDGFRPGEAALCVRNLRRIAAQPQAVWESLVRAPRWPAWYTNASHVMLPGGAAELAPGMRFRWTQTGIGLTCEVREFVPRRRLAWYAASPWIRAYHAWDIQSDDDGGGCLVVTDETQRGLLPRLFGALLEPRMRAIHDRWLERLAVDAGSRGDASAVPAAGAKASAGPA